MRSNKSYLSAKQPFGVLLLLPLTALMIAIAALSSCAHKTEQTGPETGPAAESEKERIYNEKMQSLSSTLSHLLPMVASPTKFANLENQDRIEADIKNLRRLSHSLSDGSVEKSGTPAPAQTANDPTMALVSGQFSEDIDRAAESLKAGNREYARSILRDTANYCVSCHTQTDAKATYPGNLPGGRPLVTLDLQLKDLPRLDRAEFYASTRQFPQALEEINKALADSKASKADDYIWERAARSGLAILIRVQKKPEAANAFVTDLLRSDKAPNSLKKEARVWKKDIAAWSKEYPKPTDSPKEKLNRAEKLVQRASHSQRYPLDHREDVVWFRAGGALQDLLGERNMDPAAYAKVLYLAGLTAEATRDMNFWTMHERFYELCIEKRPRSPQSRLCFARLVDSVTMGYSGSAGVQIPLEVQQKLAKLRSLANE